LILRTVLMMAASCWAVVWGSLAFVWLGMGLRVAGLAGDKAL
jgi:hypothetical protein